MDAETIQELLKAADSLGIGRSEIPNPSTRRQPLVNYSKVPVRRDGNHFFRAASYTFWHTEGYHMFFREAAVARMRAFKSEYNEGYTPEEFEDYLLKCAKFGQTADSNLQLACAEVVRHAQGVHNVEAEKDHSAYMSEEFFDAHLTPLGWQQVDNLRKHVHASGISKSVELVVVSPLLRTMQTAVGAFGGEGSAAGSDAPPLMAENTGESNRPAISSQKCPPFIAVELCRERLGVNPCDRRTVTEYKPMFPAIDFSLIENDGDVLWTSDTREKNEEVAARGVEFMKW